MMVVIVLNERIVPRSMGYFLNYKMKQTLKYNTYLAYVILLNVNENLQALF